MTIKFYHQSLEKRFVDAILIITPIKQMRNNYMQCFNIVEFVVIFFFIKNFLGINLSRHCYVCDALRDLVLFVLKNVKNTNGGVLLLVKLRFSACNFIKITLLIILFLPKHYYP